MGKHRLLIVDEYKMSRVVLATNFRLRGYSCTAVTDAESALTAIETFEPGAVILEWCFRDGSGVGLSTRLRVRSEACGRPLVIIIVSVQNEPEDFRNHESVDEYLVKPVSVELIRQAIERHTLGK